MVAQRGRPPYCFRKELIWKMWFEWSEICGYRNFAMKEVNTKDLDDSFWDRPSFVMKEVNMVEMCECFVQKHGGVHSTYLVHQEDTGCLRFCLVNCSS
ncbi:hypothetical protein C5167_015109 [Papaver somniferum]|uniref:Uncharacterized protein n=1 Tax=Papaver somniferum TaxID=3469 RepID=A0A4Y7J8J1_PAPSO|nr:hypothetical protein C5167_015109 [Papaver somniferum]